MRKENTVKECKGLEYPKVTVITAGMISNEKYIAYTRAYISLNIIKNIKISTDHSEKLYIDDISEEVDEESENDEDLLQNTTL